MLRIMLKNKKYYYIGSVILIVIICLMGPLIYLEDGEFVSVIQFMISGVNDASDIHSINSERSLDSAVSAGLSGMIWLLLPMVCSFPSAMYVCDELTSGNYRYDMFRRGRYRYICNVYKNAMLASLITVIAGIFIYVIICAVNFPFTVQYMNDMDFIMNEYKIILYDILYLVIYGASMAVIASFLMCLYTHLYFVLSSLFILSYILRDMINLQNILIPAGILLLMVPLYVLMWRFRSESI